MLIAAIPSILARLGHAAVARMRDYSRKHHNARTICHLEALPAYLRRDIGLPDDADIAAIVDHGPAGRATDREPCRPLSILPHAA